MQNPKQKGFTLIEILLVMTIFAAILGFTAVSFLKTKHTSSLNSTLDKIISDMKSQQLKAMIGSTDAGQNGSSYGIYIAQENYTLFRGNSYSSTDSANLTVSLNQNIIITNILLPNNSLVFSQKSGEISGFDSNNNSITIKNTAGNEQKTITINRYGIVTSVSP